MFIADCAQCFEKPRDWRDKIHVSSNRFNDQARDAVAILGKKILDRLRVVVGQHMGEVCVSLGNAERVGLAKRESTRAGFH